MKTKDKFLYRCSYRHCGEWNTVPRVRRGPMSRYCMNAKQKGRESRCSRKERYYRQKESTIFLKYPNATISMSKMGEARICDPCWDGRNEPLDSHSCDATKRTWVGNDKLRDDWPWFSCDCPCFLDADPESFQ